MCENTERRFPIGLLGLGLILLLAVIVLLFGRKSSEETAPDVAPPSVTNAAESTNAVGSGTPPLTNVMVRSCTTNAVSSVKPEPPSPTATPVPAATNVVAQKAPVRKIENDPKIPKNRQVLLARRRIVVESGRKFPTKFCTTQTPTARKTAPYILISEKPVDRSMQSQAMANGARVSGFLPNNALLVEADAEALKNLSEDPAFIAAVEYEPMDKVQPQMLDGKDETVEASVTLMNARYLDAMRGFVTASGGQVQKTAKNRKSFTAILPRKTITDLAGKGEVRWIERKD